MFRADEFEEPFDPVNFVERVAATVYGGGSKGGIDAFDPVKLKESFKETIGSLQKLMKETEGRITKLEKTCAAEEKQHKENVSSIEEQYQESIKKFHDLDDRINSVATKVVHLGDQLENISTPRQRVQEAQQVMKYFQEFNSSETISAIFLEPNEAHKAAPIICQLFMVSQELQTEGFFQVKLRIAEWYHAIEDNLLLEFKKAYQKGDIDHMTKCANTLLPFKKYQQCYENLIEMTLVNNFLHDDVFQDIVPACEQIQQIIIKVFENNAEMIMTQFVQTVFEKKVQGYVYKQLAKKDDDIEGYLERFAQLYGRAKDVTKKLSEFRLGSDSTFLDRLKRSVFVKYSSSYINDEIGHLEGQCKATLEKFYSSIAHQKREKVETKRIFPEGMMPDMPASLQELQRRIPGRSHHSLTENLLSQEVAVNLLQANKVAIRRCEMLSNPSELPNNAFKIFSVLLKYLGEDHFEYAIDMTLQVLPSSEPRSAPDLLFLNVLHQSNTVFHLMEKHFTDFILRSIGSSPVYSECAQKKKSLIDQLEGKLDQGMEKILSCIVGYVKHILSTEQKKSDFKTEDADDKKLTPTSQTNANSLDGKNLEVVLTEIGVRFHKTLLDHLHQFTYTSNGGMTALFDINEYRHTMKQLQNPMLTNLFTTTSALVDLFVVRPENLKDVCSSEHLAELDRSVQHQFIQLRADYKTAKIAKIFA
eukprot:gene19822-21763_t